MQNTIKLNLNEPDLAPLKDKEVGHECVLSNVKFTATKNDGQTLEGVITDVELGDQYSSDSEGQDDAATEPDGEPAAEESPAKAALFGKKM